MTSAADVLVVVALALAGGVGAALRFVVDGAVSARQASRRATREAGDHRAGSDGAGAHPGRRGPLPVGIIVVNVTGSFALGLVVGIAGALGASPSVTLVVGTGLLGGYTTFSTAMVDAARLVRAGRVGAALAVLLGTCAASVGAAFVGLHLGGELPVS